ncbi:MAG: hypothetical protein K0M40_17405 [Prolixibacteraceae bacterium]|nr:hypothetical protein [Prolixibacteraceae bacterium]
MINILELLNNPQMNPEKYFEVMRDFRKGGLNPEMYPEFIETIKQLPRLGQRRTSDFHIFDKFNLIDISEDDFAVIMREMQRRGIQKSKKCWHPEASSTTCNINAEGNIIVSAAHSIQNNGVLSKIVESGHVMGYSLDKVPFDGKKLGKDHASIFWGFCNTHDSIFRPIEISPYTGSLEQHFLFAYRGFVVAVHKKIEVSNWINFGDQADNDIIENKKIFDKAILDKDYSVIETQVFELSAFYPIAVSSSFYLEFDFEGNPIEHSDDRIEAIFVTLLPTDNRTYFLLSYFLQDKKLYGNLGNQLRSRNNLKSDITVLLAAHVENIYFNPTYYNTFIKEQEDLLETVFLEAQLDEGLINVNGEITVNQSFTPPNYLNNPYRVNFFGY